MRNTNDAGVIVDFTNNVDSSSFNFKEKNIRLERQPITENVEIMVPLKYLSNFWKILGMTLINCITNLILTLSANCVMTSCTAANQATTFAIADTKICTLVLALTA